ncbi:MAG: aminotransferase class I/II-fold pyridoxal phosphate-dependent enzyme [Alphaproteobacteria bacterium]
MNTSDSASRQAVESLLARARARRAQSAPTPTNDDKSTAPVTPTAEADIQAIPPSSYRIDQFENYQMLKLKKALADQAGLENPFFRVHDGVASATSQIEGQTVLNFATYDYLNLNGHPAVANAAIEAVRTYGVSASASRLVSGERPPHRALEQAIANLYGVDDAVALVSGHATNVTTIATLLGPRDLIIHDRLIHNSIYEGARLSGAQRRAVAHNDHRAVDALLTRERGRFEKVLIVVEGVYSMDGDIAPLNELVEIKKKHKALLMVDEAHSLGVLGATGRGCREHFELEPNDIDIWMGTLSKTLCGCGGFIAGCFELIELMKLTASGFVFSVGMPPAIAAASAKALECMLAEPERVTALQANGRCFVDMAKAAGLEVGRSAGYSVVPIIVGSSAMAARLSTELGKQGLNVQPITYPAVEEGEARLRFFITSAHTPDQIRHAIGLVSETLAELKTTFGDE